jgi:hypothetical protein
MSKEPLPVKTILLLVFFPFFFFFAVGVVTIFSSAYFIDHPLDLPQLLTSAVKRPLFTTQPPAPVLVLGETYVPKEARPILIKDFLDSYRSPLVPYADYLVATSDKYGLDWRLLVGIAGNESLFGRVIPENSYNAWGWGIHSLGTCRFRSWKHGIEEVAKGLKRNYIDQGLTTIDLIMTKYAPVSVANGYPWADKVRWFMERLEQGKGYGE